MDSLITCISSLPQPLLVYDLFTADLSEPFELWQTDNRGQEQRLRFNVITAWEVMEHIHRNRLQGVLENISHHLSSDGVVIMSVSPNEETIQGVRLHQTVENREWWIAKCAEFRLIHHKAGVDYFGQDWVRGGGNAPDSFHLVLVRAGDCLPSKNRLAVLRGLIRLRRGGRRIRQLLTNAIGALGYGARGSP